MNPQLSALFAQHRTAILGGGAALVAGLAYLRRKQSTAAAAPAGVAAAPSSSGYASSPVYGTIAGGASSAGYDSSASDVYNALGSQLGQVNSGITQILGNQKTAPLNAPKPIASTLFAPTYTGNYVQVQDGTVAEIESDGSLFGLTHAQFWANPNASAAVPGIVDMRKAPEPTLYTTAGNVSAGNPKPAS